MRQTSWRHTRPERGLDGGVEMKDGSKRYYWIKLKKDFFDLPEIDFLQDQKNGCEYIVLYQKLCLIAANHEGKLIRQVGET